MPPTDRHPHVDVDVGLTSGQVPDVELVDDAHGLVLRRVVVGALRTNSWIVHAVGSTTALLVDPGDEPARLLDAVSDLRLAAVVVTHTHFDHVLALPDIAAATGAPVLAHPYEQPVWPHELATLARTGHFDAGTATQTLLATGCSLRPDDRRPLWNGQPDGALHDRDVLTIGPLSIRVLHTPGHTPGGISLALPGHLLTGDTLFPGGPGLTGWPLSDFRQIMPSVRRLLDHPQDTLIHPGHGPDTTVRQEQPSVEDWQRRGW
jgi:glyoxylase-like metal-dependent hydrolase (beta-lactamase superfamily II)